MDRPKAMTQMAVWIIRTMTQGHEWPAFIFEAFARAFALLFAILIGLCEFVKSCQGKVED